MNMVREAVRPIASKFEIPDVRVNGSFNAFAVILPLAFLYPLLRGCNYPRPFYRSLSKSFLALGLSSLSRRTKKGYKADV